MPVRKNITYPVLIFTSPKCSQKQVQIFIPTFTQAGIKCGKYRYKTI